MSVRRYRRLPPRAGQVVSAARYEPGGPGALAALAEVARLHDPSAELAEAVFASGPVAVVRYRVGDGRGMTGWAIISPGWHLAAGGALWSTSDGELSRWYEEIT